MENVIYYTGDMANDSGFFKQTEEAGRVRLNEIDGNRSFLIGKHQISNVYTRGFVTVDAYNKYRQSFNFSAVTL